MQHTHPRGPDPARAGGADRRTVHGLHRPHPTRRFWCRPVPGLGSVHHPAGVHPRRYPGTRHRLPGFQSVWPDGRRQSGGGLGSAFWNSRHPGCRLPDVCSSPPAYTGPARLGDPAPGTDQRGGGGDRADPRIWGACPGISTCWGSRPASLPPVRSAGFCSSPCSSGRGRPGCCSVPRPAVPLCNVIQMG